MLGPEGRNHRIGRLRLPAAAGSDRPQRPAHRLQGCRRGPAGRRPSARPRHGAQGPAAGKRQDLHRPGRGAEQGGQP
ncbi:hypothetical protein G6F51_014352 [Rhizopus arrhizus]|uniref:Uncharacterized protein n=1 Tax=Rhizopus oryzae TaxID=64495 RepID=A0A9P6XMV3_RHIOR|nr:hypothetical protein G6F51_014352 [Rhizopus arrhizus]